MSLPQVCTGITAVWCPLHGQCMCPEDEDGILEWGSNPDCPIHAEDSNHAEFLTILKQTIDFYEALL